MKRILFACLAIAAVIFSSCTSDVKDTMEIIIDNKSDFDLSNVRCLDISINSLGKNSQKTVESKGGTGPVTFNFLTKTQGSIMAAKTVQSFSVAENQRKITIDNETMVMDVDQNTNTGTLSAITSNLLAVTYNANGASGTAPEPQRVASGASVTVAGQGGLTFSGKSFTGWNTDASGSGTDYTAASSLTVTANITLYAQWSNSGGGTGSLVGTVWEASEEEPLYYDFYLEKWITYTTYYTLSFVSATNFTLGIADEFGFDTEYGTYSLRGDAITLSVTGHGSVEGLISGDTIILMGLSYTKKQ